MAGGGGQVGWAAEGTGGPLAGIVHGAPRLVCPHTRTLHARAAALRLSGNRRLMKMPPAAAPCPCSAEELADGWCNLRLRAPQGHFDMKRSCANSTGTGNARACLCKAAGYPPGTAAEALLQHCISSSCCTSCLPSHTSVTHMHLPASCSGGSLRKPPAAARRH